MSKMEQNVHRATSPSRQLAHKNHQNICAEEGGGGGDLNPDYEAQSKHVYRQDTTSFAS